LQTLRIDAKISDELSKPEQDVSHGIRVPLPDFQADIRRSTGTVRLQLITLVIQRHLVVSKDDLPKPWSTKLKVIKILVKSFEDLIVNLNMKSSQFLGHYTMPSALLWVKPSGW